MTGYRWDFASVFANADILLRGALGTLQLAVVGFGAGLVLGLALGAARVSTRRLLNWPATAFVELFRNTPALVQIMWFFYAFPILIGVQIGAFAAASLALSLNTAAFCAEIFRGGIQSITRGQWEAGRALGMTYPMLMRRVILPQAVKRMIPAFTNRGLELAKMTSLASTIAVAELLYEGRLLSSITYRPIETYTTVAVLYFVLLQAGALAVDRLEARLRKAD
ncbi:MAG TPA: amino acid ABC transporter permease [Thermodesulfobacteriota bacterium]